MSWPVIGTIMIEPTESETIDNWIALLIMIAIREEIAAIEKGESDAEDNVLRHAPFTIAVLSADVWPYSFSRTQAGWPNGLQRAKILGSSDSY